MGPVRSLLHKSIADNIRLRRIVLVLAVLVVFVTTYLLVLPAFTLDRQKAAEQGGIDVPYAGSASDQSVQPQDADAGISPELTGTSAGAQPADSSVMNTSGGDDDPSEAVHAAAGSTSDGSENLVYDGEGYRIVIEDSNSALPPDAKLAVAEIDSDSDPEAYKDLLNKAGEAVRSEEGAAKDKPQEISFARFYDISFTSDGKKISPDDTIKVTITYDKDLQKDLKADSKDDVRVIQFSENEETGETEPEILDSSKVDATVRSSTVKEASFDADECPVYALVGTTIEENVLASDGHNYKVSVTYGEESGIPAGAALAVTEITSGRSINGISYDDYVAETARALGADEGQTDYIRLFDIKIVDKDDPDVQYQPAEGTSVDVKIELADAEEGTGLRVVHFEDHDRNGVVVKHKAEGSGKGQAVLFKADGFSVYAISTDFTTPVYEDPAVSIQENTGYYFSNQSRYVTNSIYNSANPNGLGKTTDRRKASLFYFEKADGDDPNAYYVYTYPDGESSKQYVYFEYLSNNDGHVKLSDEKPDQPLTITASDSSNGVYLIAGSDTDTGGNVKTWYLNQYGGTGGARFAGYYKGSNDNGSKITVTKPAELPNDAFGLDGKEFGLMNFKSDISGYLMMADAISNNTRLERKWTLIKEDPLEHSGRLFIAEDVDAPMWKFHAVGGDKYYLTTEIDGHIKFLSVSSSGLSLTDSLSDSCIVTLMAGTGSYSGKLMITGSDGSVLRMHENTKTNGFGTTTANENANDWLNLVVKSSLNDEDFVSYSAQKVSVSDTVNVPDGKQVVIYTRTWNDTTKQYEFYAIDHDGSLARVYENGTELQWVGTQVNTLLWDFTEYHNSDGTPNYYYEFQNSYSGKYLAPQIRGDQILADSPVGVNLNGRRYEEYETTILAWDDPDYQYSGFKVEDGQLVPCPMRQSDEFYFAIMETEATGLLTTVNTVDNDTYGISMKMIDYNGQKTDNNGNIGQDKVSFDKTQTDVMGSTGNDKGLVTPYLEEDGYPTAVKTGISLSELFEDAYPVNHLFLERTYNESGYFEYNCTENFAHLIVDEDDPWLQYGYEIGDFVVYDQVGTIETDNNSLKHGQFMPYNDLDGSVSDKWSNQTDETDAVLPYTDPRKDKLLYTIPYNKRTPEGVNNNANYHFGMEMTANFTQTADGLDAWGHDIIFEFAGDDDMFLFVDDVLILDLGGVHAAQTGKVNFRTGQMTSSRGNQSLLDLFKASYKAQHNNSEEGMNEWLEGIFKKDARGNFTPVFLDYSTHTMRMIYMERGAGASNLHMRFNLAAVKPGTVILNKTVSGLEEEDTIVAEYPYQIWYSMMPPGDDTEQDWNLLGSEPGDQDLVKYVGSSRNVKYSESYTVNDVAEPYQHVFFLKPDPDEAAEITLPEGAKQYKIVECGVNPRIYDTVKVNGVAIEGTPAQNQENEKLDFWTSAATLDERQSVTYDNHVRDDAVGTMSFTKTLYDVEGTRITDNNTKFNFRLELGGENSSETTPAYMQAYHVKDKDGNYCRWDNTVTSFVKIGSGITDYSQLTAEQREQATFHSSINGAIASIPVDYTVEVRHLLLDTTFKVIERESEVPVGYSWKAYLLDNVLVQDAVQNDGVSGIIENDQEHKAEIQNYKGWGMTVEKVWSDADYMAYHDSIYFAVFTKDANDELTMIPDTLREMPGGSTSLYWYFDALYNEATFDQHVIREVQITGGIPEEPDAEGVIPNETSLTLLPVVDGGTLPVLAAPKIDNLEGTYNYTASYAQGDPHPEDDNIRVDTVTNSRAGIRIVKTDWDDEPHPLSGARFTLQYKEGEGDEAVWKDAGAEYYTSDAEGLVTTAYLPEGEFRLTETVSPSGYSGLSDPVIITIDAEGNISLRGAAIDADAYGIDSDLPEPVITVRNKPFTLKAVKVDGSADNAPLQGIHFALYRQITGTNGQLIPDYYPITGYNDLESGADGIIPEITQGLPAGTYYLREIQTLDKYKPIDHDICFTISPSGIVTLNNEAGFTDRILDSTTEDDGSIAYTLTIVNTEAIQYVQIKKVDIAVPQDSALEGAEFDLYRVIDGDREAEPMYSGLVSNSSGMLEFTEGGQTRIKMNLPVGVYHLIETKAPAGYNLKDEPVIITVTSRDVTYDEHTTLSDSGAGRIYEPNSNTYTLLVSDTAGHELPMTGGPGTALFYIIGALLVNVSGIGLVTRRRLFH